MATLLDHYRVFYRAVTRDDVEPVLPEGFAVADAAERELLADEERAVLQQHFTYWQGPALREMPGWRPDSVILLTDRGKLVGGIYLRDENEIADDGAGQVDYVFVTKAYTGFFEVLVRMAVWRAREWGLDGVWLVTDRKAVPRLLQRVGVEDRGTRPKRR